MFETTSKIPSPSGATLAYHHQPATASAIGILIICHGLAEHSKRYRAFAEAMAAAGFHVYAHDHRGHGETTAEGAPIGRFAWRDGITATIRDVKAMRDFAATAHPGLPVVLFGHSMGGLIALNAVQDFPASFDALAIWNSNFNPGLAGRAAQIVLKTERALKGSDVPSTLLPKLTFGAWNKSIGEGRTDFDWLSRDHAAVDAYIADPLCGFNASVSLWLDIFDLTFRGTETDRLETLPKTLPIHLVGGGRDPATGNGQAIKWLSRRLQTLSMTNVTCNIDRDMRHETLNEIGAEAAITEFAAWATRVLPKQSATLVPD
ncbi:alpha/beta hydrolase [Neorhizobium sp. JUb45]|uniref:alpha/beta fold hydrolase n=1 Tax=unclassified Neorhizobium TaxID=2629175 RepID=UPI0010458F93|nr:alpha/beta hydrolase [Neorhizobium sp. JUb45]TCR06996.1 alpha-beta hydrolase superfamily lysophospholipase [Neorhizobium sp. JUb45]